MGWRCFSDWWISTAQTFKLKGLTPWIGEEWNKWEGTATKRRNLSAPKSGKKNLEKQRNKYFFLKAFSTPWFLLSTPTNHTLIYFLLEMLNNLIQYQFDGNSNLVYTIIRKRAVFHNLAHLPSDGGAISKFVDYLFIRIFLNDQIHLAQAKIWITFRI